MKRLQRAFTLIIHFILSSALLLLPLGIWKLYELLRGLVNRFRL